MLKKASMLFTLFSFLSSPVRAGEELSFPGLNIHLIDIQNAQGNIKIESSVTVGNISVTLSKGEYLSSCKLTTELKRGRLIIVSKASNKFFGKDICQLDIAMKVPKTIDLELRVGSGDVVVENIRGLIDYKIGSGTLTIAKVNASRVIGRTGSGDVEIEGNLADVDLKIGAGNAKLTFQTAPAEGSLDIKIGSGTTTVNLPETSNISSKFKSGTGSLTNQFQNQVSAKYKISGTTGTGDMLINKI